jgi:DNA-binding MarR family transcriptional regulator
VARSSDAIDRRRTVVSLLARSDEQFAEVAQAYNAELGEWANEMTDAEWNTVLSFIQRVTEIAERRAQELRSSAQERALG